MEISYKLKKVGILKYSRIVSISILKNQLDSFGYDYSLNDVKKLFDSVLNNEISYGFSEMLKYCFDQILDDNEYIKFLDIECDNEKNFPDNYISPIG